MNRAQAGPAIFYVISFIDDISECRYNNSGDENDNQ